MDKNLENQCVHQLSMNDEDMDNSKHTQRNINKKDRQNL